jgi:glutamine amidotransferase
MTAVGILNFRSSNSLPLFNTISGLGFKATLINSPDLISSQDKLIIPGVGHVNSLMRELELGHYREPILEYAKTGKFVLGICLGMHALTSGSQEDPSTRTLELFSSKVVPLRPNAIMRIRVPHVGWNSVLYSDESLLFRNIPQESDFYFTHSFAVVEVNRETIGTTSHGDRFSSVINNRNIFGVQFHPEKSQKCGERILSNFCELDL